MSRLKYVLEAVVEAEMGEAVVDLVAIKEEVGDSEVEME